MNTTTTQIDTPVNTETATIQAGQTHGAPLPAIRHWPYEGPWTRDYDSKNEYSIQGDVVFVKLTRGKVGVVDLSSWGFLRCYRWFASSDGFNDYWYAYAGTDPVTKKRVRLKGHRVVASPQPGQCVDHINNDGLDNRRSNLRCCTQSQNCRNRIGNSRNTSGFVGVSLLRGRWQAYIGTLTGMKHVGMFGNPEDAARARDIAAIELHGEFASLNFPRETYAI